MGIDTREAPLTVHQREFGNVLDTLVIHCADVGVVIEPDLHLALSKKGADHRLDIINALFAARNVELEAKGEKSIPLVDEEGREDHPMRRNIRSFQWFLRSQMVAAGWVPAEILTPPNNRDALDRLREDFDAAGIGIQLNRGLLKGHSREAGMYRVRMAGALHRLHKVEAGDVMGSEFAAAVAFQAQITNLQDAPDHPVYADPDLLMAMIRDRSSYMQGNHPFPGSRTHG